MQLAPLDAEIAFNRGTVRAAAGDVTSAVSDWQWAVDGLLRGLEASR